MSGDIMALKPGEMEMIRKAQEEATLKMVGKWLDDNYHYRSVVVGVPENPPASEGYYVKISNRYISIFKAGVMPRDVRERQP